jgi:hypothetical protein
MQPDEFAKKMATFDQEAKQGVDILATIVAGYFNGLVERGVDQNSAIFLANAYQTQMIDKLFSRALGND